MMTSLNYLDQLISKDYKVLKYSGGDEKYGKQSMKCVQLT